MLKRTYPTLTGLTRAPGLKEFTAGLEALDTPTASTLRAGERGAFGPEGDHPASAGGAPTGLPGGGQALLPPPAKGPGSAGSVTLAGWFLIFLARFFSRAPDISGGVAEPLRSGQRWGEVGGRCSRSPWHQPRPGAHSRRGLPRHTWTPTPRHSACAPPDTCMKDYISQKPPRAVVGGACVAGRWGEEGRTGGTSTDRSFSTGSGHGLAREENNQHY